MEYGNSYQMKMLWVLFILSLKKELQKLLLTELIEVPLISVNKYQVVNTKLQDMYVAFTDFNTGLRSAWLS